MPVYAAEATELIRSRPGFAREIVRQLVGKKGVGLTSNQSEMLAYIRGYVKDHDGVSPSFDEMKEALGISSKSYVHRLVVALEERGHIVRIPGHSRSIVLRGA